MAESSRSPTNPPGIRPIWWFVGALAAGCLVSLGLGAYGRHHQPTYEAITTFGFPTEIEMKVWLAVAVVVLALVQVISALRMYGRLGSAPPSKAVALTHRVSGVAAVVISLPVAFHCLWSLGFQDYTNRVLAHSLLGCLFYGVFVSKMLALQIKRLPGWAIPVLGGLTFATLIGVVSTSMVWWFTHGRPTY